MTDPNNDHDHDHDHGEHDHAHPHPTKEDNDLELTPDEAKFLAMKALLIEKGILTAAEIQARLEYNDLGSPLRGAAMVARAWTDPSFRELMLRDARAAAINLGFDVAEPKIVGLENTSTRHNLIVCTLCSCYPRSLLGEPPAWYVSKAYRSRAVKEPRKVLREFGVTLPDSVEVTVHDSTADVRYIVIPVRPQGSEGMSEEELATLVTRDSIVGAGFARTP